MRRWAAILAVSVVTLALTGCGAAPDGVDGDLTDGWGPMPAAGQFRPAAGTCHAELRSDAPLDEYAPVPCAGKHVAETVAVTDLTGADGLDSPRRAVARAYAECSRKAVTFLGGDWRTGWMMLQPVLPARTAWAAGARWVRCDLAETSPADGALITRSGSLQGALGDTGKLRMSCADADVESSQVTGLQPVSCERAHTAEFAGLWTTTRARASDITGADLQRGCTRVIAAFTGLRNDGTVHNRVGWLGFPPDGTAWDLGDRAVRCFLWLDGQRMTGSYRDAGPGRLPILYRN